MTSYVKMKLKLEDGSEVVLPIKVGGYTGKSEISSTSIKKTHPNLSQAEAEKEASLYDIRDAYVAWIPKLSKKVKSDIKSVKVHVPNKGWVSVPVKQVTERKARAHGTSGNKVYSGQNIWFDGKPFQNYKKSTIRAMRDEGVSMLKEFTLTRDVRKRVRVPTELGMSQELTRRRGDLSYYKNWNPKSDRPHRVHGKYVEVLVTDYRRSKPVNRGDTHVRSHWRKVGTVHGEYIWKFKKKKRNIGGRYV